MNKFWPLKIIVLVLILGVSVYLYLVPWQEVPSTILKLRFVRLLLTLVAGYTLSINGAVLQSVLRNQLADPYLVGVTGGALVGFTLGELSGIRSSFFLSLPAFLFSTASIILVYYLAKRGGKVRKELLVLSGLFINFFSYSFVFLMLVSKQEVLERIIYILWGYTGIILQKGEFIPFISITILLFLIPMIFLLLSKELDAISLGEAEAVSIGVDVEKLKRWTFLLTSFTTAIIVSLAGAIGFIGLMIPNIIRRIIGGRHIVLLPAAGFGGALLALLADYISRVLTPYELPLGIITSLLGVPFFVWLLIGGGYEGDRS
ncbi:MAG TPA: iron ABC transporter permease [candidate division WOR-3 bacterium]|uniref:Iron ABC transporter permease n=1 Tax=candidate division WOR-3 bacterium TaxID=2052148 RepID=A0A7V5LU92_UNCW3|nr:iron ABC transporter permease [candidate division WOR-3 bacterium]